MLVIVTAEMKITVTKPEHTEISNSAAHLEPSRYIPTPRRALATASAIADLNVLRIMTAAATQTRITARHTMQIII